MAPRRPRWIETVLAAALLTTGAAAPAAAVSTDGSPFRIDVDPGTRSYNIGDYLVAATTTGAFAVSWEEATAFQVTFKPEKVKLRRFTTKLAPTGSVLTVDPLKRKTPQLAGLAVLGNTLAYPVVTGFFKLADGTNRVDALAQTVTMSSGKTTAAKQLNDANDGDFDGSVVGLKDGRAVFAWTNGTGPESKQQFVTTTGVKSGSARSLGQTSPTLLIDRMVALGDGYLAVYNDTRSTSSRWYGQVYSKTGSRVGTLKPLTAKGPVGATIGVAVRSDGKILVTEWKLNRTNSYDLWGQLYDAALKAVGTPKVLVAKGNAKDYLTLVSLPSGKVALGRTFIGSPSYRGSVTLLTSTLAVSGKVFSFATNGKDQFQLTKLGSKLLLTRSAVVESRERLVGQVLKY